MTPNMTAPFASPYPYLNPVPSASPTGMVFVKDENEALNYPSLRGSMVALFDQREDVKQFYVKTVDMAGNIKPLQTFRYEEITPNAEVSTSGSVSIEEFNSLKNELDEIKQLLTEQTHSKNHGPNQTKGPIRKENRNG